MKRRIKFYLVLLSAGFCFSQGISVKTVPLLSTDQFSLVPSFRDDMAGVSIAVRDGLQDLFINPGNYNVNTESQWFVVPRLSNWHYSRETSIWTISSSSTYYRQTRNESKSSLFTVPTGLFLKMKNLYTGAMVGGQAVSSSNGSSAHFKASNYPGAWFGGVYLPSLKLSIGIGIDYVRIRGIDGVYLLYPNARQLEQRGSARQFRFGFGSAVKNDRWNFLVSRYFFSIRQTEQNVVNKDENNGWVINANYMKKLSEPLTLGFMATVDTRHHPKIPEYPLAGIPRDPGDTQALNFGLGLQWQNETTLFGLDVIFEPVDVKTWADAASEQTTWDGRVFHAGDVTMRNDYQFSNRLIRAGVRIKPNAWLSLMTGAQLKLLQYDWYQNDFINRVETRGTPQRQWSETTWTAGLQACTGKFVFTWSLRLDTGTGLLERQWWGWWSEVNDLNFAKADFLIPPSVTLNVTPVTYYTQRLGLSYFF